MSSMPVRSRKAVAFRNARQLIVSPSMRRICVWRWPAWRQSLERDEQQKTGKSKSSGYRADEPDLARVETEGVKQDEKTKTRNIRSLRNGIRLHECQRQLRTCPRQESRHGSANDRMS